PWVPTRFTFMQLAKHQLDGLQRRGKKAVLDFLQAVAGQGCAALGYRLTGDDPIERICIKHLYGSLRVAVSFDTLDHVWVLLIAPHDERNPATDICAMLYALVGVETPVGERTKPSCCDETGAPPIYEVAELLADGMRSLRRTRN